MNKKTLIIMVVAMMLISTKMIAYATEYNYVEIISKTDVPSGIYIGSYLFDKGVTEDIINISSSDVKKNISVEGDATDYSVVNEGNTYLLINQSYDSMATYNQYGAVINNSPIYFFDNNMNLISKKEFVGHMMYEGYYGNNFYFSFSDYSARYYDESTSLFKGSITKHYYKTPDGCDFKEITYDDIASVQNDNNTSKLMDGNQFYIEDEELYLREKQGNKKVLSEPDNYAMRGAITSNGNILYKVIYANGQVVSKKLSVDAINYYAIPADTVLSNIKCDKDYLYCGIAGRGDVCYKIELSNFENGVKVIYDGEYLSFATAPVSQQGRILVPMRFLFEQMGARVDWDNSTQKATVNKNDDIIEFSINDSDAVVNGSGKTMDVPARIIDGKTMIPLRFLSEELGYTVLWDDETNTVTIHD